MVNATRYPGANTTARWKGNGNATLSTINKIVLHTTESSALPSYSASWPNLTYDPKTRNWWQHTPINGSATALKNSGSNQTNRANVVQIEIIGFAKDSANLPQSALDDLGAFAAWMNVEWEVPLLATPKWTGPNTTARMTWCQFSAFKGILGHQHVPGNIHWDPGLINAEGIVTAAKKHQKPAGTYTVVAGDTFYGIARKLGVTVADLEAANPGVEPARLQVGQVLNLVPAPKPEPTPEPTPPPEPEWSPVRTLLNLNAQWPGFASTKTALPWSTRCRLIGEAIVKSKATVATIQELGKDEAAQLSAHLPGWKYQRAQGGGLGLNCVFWKTAEWDFVKLYDWDLKSFGQMQRTMLAVKLQNKDGSYVWAGATHLAAAASDLSAADAIVARTEQAKQVADLLDGFRQVLVGADWNSKYPQTSTTSVRGILHAQGFTFKPPINDGKHNGIDGVGAKQRVQLLTETVYPLGQASDHDGRLVTFNTPKG